MFHLCLPFTKNIHFLNMKNQPHFVASQHKLELYMGWESIKSRAEVLGLTVYHKIHFNKTQRLVQQCQTGPDNNLYNLRNNGNKRLRYPQLGKMFNNSYFNLFTNLWVFCLKKCIVLISIFSKNSFTKNTNLQNLSFSPKGQNLAIAL